MKLEKSLIQIFKHKIRMRLIIRNLNYTTLLIFWFTLKRFQIPKKMIFTKPLRFKIFRHKFNKLKIKWKKYNKNIEIKLNCVLIII